MSYWAKSARFPTIRNSSQADDIVFLLRQTLSIADDESGKNGSKPEKRNRNEENRRQIVVFIADNGISDSKTIALKVEEKVVTLRSENT